MNMRPFQIILIGAFGFFAIVGMVFLSLYSNDSSRLKPYGDTVVIWGTVDQAIFTDVLRLIIAENKEFEVVSYTEIDERTFDEKLTTAIAEGRAPDLVLLSHDRFVQHRAKILPLSYETMSERLFLDTYVDGADIFMRPDGIYGLPVAVDPLVMYWNKDIFSSSGVASAPTTWEELVSVVVPNVTRTNTRLDVLQSAVSFGEYRNVRFAKQIISMLVLQAGSDLVDEVENTYRVTFGLDQGGGLEAADTTLSFYTQFALPSHANYTWNRSLREDHLQFLSGELGIYFAPGSLYGDLQKENPNLNFDIAKVPQGAGATALRTYGTFYALAIPRGSQNQAGAFAAAQVLGSEDVSAILAEQLNFAPVHRGEIALGVASPYRRVLYDMALIAHGWLDPRPTESDTVFRQMVEDVTSGRSRISDAVLDAGKRLELLF